LRASKSAFSFRKAVEGVVKILIYLTAAHTNGGGNGGIDGVFYAVDAAKHVIIVGFV